MRPSSTARRYAEAAFDVAHQDGNADQWLADLRRVQQLLDRPIVRQYFEEPNVSREEKVETLPRLFPDLPEHVLNLLRILTNKHRMHLIPAVADELERLIRESRGITEATVTVARPVDEQERREIAQRLGTLLGKQVVIHTEVDESIIGGIVIRIGDQLMDASVAGRFERLRQELAV
jgi:F-type H+-transporting ATPase subunit delta